MFDKRITDIAHDMMLGYIEKGAKVVDLTVGNGYDTVFLAQTVGQAGQVYGFDIQEIAIKEATNRLIEKGLDAHTSLYLSGHENILHYIKEPINGAMMNLGYLPKGDKGIITTPKTTIKAINDTCTLLDNKGVMVIIVYYGHEGGLAEKEAVEAYLLTLDERKFDVLTLFYPNRTKSAPILHCIRKK